MTRISIRHCLRAPSSAIGGASQRIGVRAERVNPAGRLSTLVRAAMICGALAVTAGWDTASAWSGGQGSASTWSGNYYSRQQHQHGRRHAHAGATPLRHAYKHYRAERRQLSHAAARFAHNPRHGTYRRLGREYRQARAARGKFYHTAARYARSSHYASARPLHRAYRHYRAERRQFYHAAARVARAPRHGNLKGLRHEFKQFRSARAGFHHAATHFARRK